jgi:hypothetical protein
MIGFVIAGFLGVTTFQGGKYERWDRVVVSKTEKQFNIDEEYEKMMRKMDLSDYEPVPIKRPPSATAP